MSEKETSQNGTRRCAKLLRLQCSDLDVVERCHEVGGDLSRLLLSDSVGGILLPGLEDELQCATVLGRASLSE